MEDIVLVVNTFLQNMTDGCHMNSEDRRIDALLHVPESGYIYAPLLSQLFESIWLKMIGFKVWLQLR
jgi:hypothetical protein